GLAGALMHSAATHRCCTGVSPGMALHIFRRQAVYYWRRRIPRALANVLGRQHLGEVKGANGIRILNLLKADADRLERVGDIPARRPSYCRSANSRCPRQTTRPCRHATTEPMVLALTP